MRNSQPIAVTHQLLLLNREVQVLRHSARDWVYLSQETGSETSRERMFSLPHPVFVRSEEGRWVKMRSKESSGEL